MNTAALEGALLVFHPGSGATIALTGDLRDVFEQLQRGHSPIDGEDPERVDNCLRLLRQQQLIQVATP